MSIAALRLKELDKLGMPDYRTISIAEQHRHIAALRDVAGRAAFYGMFGYDECLDALLRAAFMRGIERGRGTDARWDDTEWLADEVARTRGEQ